MEALPIVEYAALVIWGFVTVLFLISLVIRRNDIADIAWGPGIALVGWTTVFTQPEPSNTLILLSCLVSIWALRLGVRIGRRNMRKKGEDTRYRKWRESWKWFYLRSYFQVYILQGSLMIIMAYPLIHIAGYGDPSNATLVLLGIVLWAAGLLFEAVSDYQLDVFLQDPKNKGQVMQSGLWKYSRHPNYFGEVVLWWGIWIAVISAPSAYIALVSPLLITFLILKVSGIPMLEKHFEGNEAFEEYKKRTSVFIPLPPKKL